MTPLLAQFVTESRDLLEQASRALLALERDAADRQELDALFRAVHTVKGASGLFEYSAFTRTVHAGEDLLDAVRAGDVAFTSEIADLVFEMLDRVSGWLDDLERTETLSEGAEAASDGLSRRLRERIGGALPVEPPEPGLAGLADMEPAPDGAAEDGCLVTYRPVETAFFTGDDPLRIALTAPGLLWMELFGAPEAAEAEDFDPFLVRTGFRIACSAPRDEIENHFRYCDDQVEFAALEGGASQTAADGPPATVPTATALELVEAQRRLIACKTHEGIRGSSLAAAQEVLRRVASRLDARPACEQLADTALPGEDLERIAGELVALLSDTSEVAPRTSEPAPPDPSVPPEPAADVMPRKTSVLRVDAERIDTLMNLTGELIVAKNAMPFLARRAEQIEGARELLREIKAQHDMINRITEELQTAVLQIRMVPVGSVLGRFNRLVRDLARKLGKQIALETTGEDTEADKSVVEELSDPLVHLIRNAIDHGLETPQERRAVGKSETGTIRLNAYQRDDSVVIEVADDGRGIDVERVKAKALAGGTVDADALERMTEEAALQLILTPGLSTKEAISDLSGRGVGMDVVAAMVRRVGGTVSVASTGGEGTTVRISLPLSMAVQRLMMIEVESNLFGIPIETVVESQKIPAERIRRHRDSEMFLLRDRMIPLLRLRRLFRQPPPESEETVNVMVVNVEGHEIGLVVDRFHPGVDAIVKPMSGLLAQARCYSGTALLGDGSVLLALDLPEILECHLN